MITIVMPQMGESLAEGTLVKWLKVPGDPVARDEPLFEISTDKVDTEVPAPAAGVLKQVLVSEGQTVAIGTVVAVIEPTEAADAVSGGFAVPETRPADTSLPAAGKKLAEAPPEPSGHFRVAQPAEIVSFRRATPLEAAAPSGTGAQARSFSPAVLKIAQQGGVPPAELVTIRGSGRGGRLTKRDIEQYLSTRSEPHSRTAAEGMPSGASESARPVAAPFEGAGSPAQVPLEYLYVPGPEDERVPMSQMRQRIADHMAWSVRISPHATAFAECDLTRVAGLIERHRERFEAREGAPLTYTVFAAAAAVAALGEFRSLNASVVGHELVLKPRVHLGIAVALPESDGLIVPVVRDADTLSVVGLARAMHDLATRARTKRLRPEEVQGGTFTLTNPGIFGGVAGTPILNQPQVAILGLGAVVKRPVVVNDAIAIRSMMTLSLTFDHRAADGMVAFRYLDRVRAELENFLERSLEVSHA